MRQRTGLLFTFVIGSAFILSAGCSSNNQKERLSEATKEEISGLRQEVTELNVALNECRNQQAAVEAPPAKKEAKKETASKVTTEKATAKKVTAKKVTAKKETTIKEEVTAKKEPQPKVIKKTVVIEKQAPPVVVEKKEEVVEVKQEVPLPPPDRYEVPDHPPSPDAIWLSGYWDWDGEEYVWIKGRWVEEGSPTS